MNILIYSLLILTLLVQQGFAVERLKLENILVEKKELPMNDKAPLVCGKVEGFKAEALTKEIRIEKTGSNKVVTLPVVLSNPTDKPLIFCQTFFSYSPFNPAIIIELHAKSGLTRNMPRHGGGFGPDYYPSPEDKIIYSIYQLPPQSEVVLSARSRALQDYYKFDNPKDVEVAWSTTMAGGHGGTFNVDWTKIPEVKFP